MPGMQKWISISHFHPSFSKEMVKERKENSRIGGKTREKTRKEQRRKEQKRKEKKRKGKKRKDETERPPAGQENTQGSDTP